LSKFKSIFAATSLACIIHGAAFALDVEDFSCVRQDNKHWDFRKLGNSGVLIRKKVFSAGLFTEEFSCNTGVKAKSTLFCASFQDYGGGSRLTKHVVFLNNYSLLLMSTSTFGPSGDYTDSGNLAVTYKVLCM
jgi:hypothetical protein